jgi:hypothetical protein
MKTTADQKNTVEFNSEKQRNILLKLNNDQLFQTLKNNFNSMHEKIFCAVRTPEAIQKLIYITIDIFRSRGIEIHEMKKNEWVQLDHFNYDYSQTPIRLYDKVKNEMVFTKIGVY